MEVVIEVAGAAPGLKYIVRSYPLDKDARGVLQYYEVPVYFVHIWKAKNHREPATYTAKETFRAIRFGVYNNDGSHPEYKARGRFVVGLAEDRWHRLNRYINYRLHSRPDNPDNGAWVIEGTHYIHSGPALLSDSGYGTAGCVEIVGKGEFIRLGEILMAYCNAKSKEAVPRSAPVWIHMRGVARPLLKPVTSP